MQQFNPDIKHERRVKVQDSYWKERIRAEFNTTEK